MDRAQYTAGKAAWRSLIVACEDYDEAVGRLHFCIRDAQAIHECICECTEPDVRPGETQAQKLLLNPDPKALLEAVAWLLRPPAAERSFLYWAGHSYETNGRNHLLPIRKTMDDDGATISDVCVQDLRMQIPKGGLLFAVIHGCRNQAIATMCPSPPPSLKSRRRRLFSDWLLLFAALAGEAVDDQSTFARNLCDALPVPGLEVEQLVRAVKVSFPTHRIEAQVSLRSPKYVVPKQCSPRLELRKADRSGWFGPEIVALYRAGTRSGQFSDEFHLRTDNIFKLAQSPYHQGQWHETVAALKTWTPERATEDVDAPHMMAMCYLHVALHGIYRATELGHNGPCWRAYQDCLDTMNVTMALNVFDPYLTACGFAAQAMFIERRDGHMNKAAERFGELCMDSWFAAGLPWMARIRLVIQTAAVIQDAGTSKVKRHEAEEQLRQIADKDLRPSWKLTKYCALASARLKSRAEQELAPGLSGTEERTACSTDEVWAALADEKLWQAARSQRKKQWQSCIDGLERKGFFIATPRRDFSQQKAFLEPALLAHPLDVILYVLPHGTCTMRACGFATSICQLISSDQSCMETYLSGYITLLRCCQDNVESESNASASAKPGYMSLGLHVGILLACPPSLGGQCEALVFSAHGGQVLSLLPEKPFRLRAHVLCRLRRFNPDLAGSQSSADRQVLPRLQCQVTSDISCAQRLWHSLSAASSGAAPARHKDLNAPRGLSLLRAAFVNG